MQKLILTSGLLLSIASMAQAQHVRLGVKGGLNISSATNDQTGLSDVSNKIGFGAYAGGLAEFSLKTRSDKFKLQLEANYNLTQLKHDYSIVGRDYESSTTLHSINIPLLAKYFFIPSFSLYAGPTANLNLSHNYKTNASMIAPTTSLNPFQVGIMAGANYYIRKGLFIEARYHAVLPDVYESNPMVPAYGTIHNFQVGIGYKFK